MAHITLPEGFPGIRGPMMFRPETAKPLNELVEVLLRGPGTLSPGERELIATYVSARNDCTYCHSIHGAIAAHHLGGNEELVQSVRLDSEQAAISEKMKALLAIAGKVQLGGKNVTSADVERARPGRHRSGDSRYRSDRGRILFVQSVCRRPRDLDSGRP
jgi:AhpD family alkylhydroperoxidase